MVLKLLAHTADRPQDAQDLVALRRDISDGEIERAGEAAALVEERGFARGRDLRGQLDAWAGS